jgi:hypothetical protein
VKVGLMVLSILFFVACLKESIYAPSIFASSIYGFMAIINGGNAVGCLWEMTCEK